jgi:hypothetical protein
MKVYKWPECTTQAVEFSRSLWRELQLAASASADVLCFHIFRCAPRAS